jgi:hypothetical protein
LPRSHTGITASPSIIEQAGGADPVTAVALHPCGRPCNRGSRPPSLRPGHPKSRLTELQPVRSNVAGNRHLAVGRIATGMDRLGTPLGLHPNPGDTRLGGSPGAGAGGHPGPGTCAWSLMLWHGLQEAVPRAIRRETVTIERAWDILGDGDSSTQLIVEPGDGRSHLGPTSRQTERCAWTEFQVSLHFRSCRGWSTDSHW